MGQKVNPHGLRVGVIKDWDSRWYASDEKVGDLIVEDQKIRKYLKKTLYGAGVPKIEIERSNEVVTIFLHCARPGMVIGKGGEQIEQYRLAVFGSVFFYVLCPLDEAVYFLGGKVENIYQISHFSAQLSSEGLSRNFIRRSTSSGAIYPSSAAT